MELRLDLEQVGTAAQVQEGIDRVAAHGGRVILPECDLVLDRGLILRSGVELIGQGPGTVLRKGAGRIYPLTGYHNYGMTDVPLETTEGLAVGMTVSVHDDRTHGGFYETFAVITWIDGSWVGLDHGVEADYQAAAHPCLTTVHPLIFGHGIRAAAVRDLCLEGNRAASPKGMGGCRGGSVYFANSAGLEIHGIREADFHGEGLSFQMCRDVRIIDCRFDRNSGNGLHPGAGSTNALFERCAGDGNDRSGFFFCVRANRITVRGCTFRGNGSGISIGTRDCHNLIEDCTVEENKAAGILARESPRPTEVHSCLIRRCRVWGNGRTGGQGQVEIQSDAHDLIVEECDLGGTPGKPGIYAASTARGLFLAADRFSGCDPEVTAEPGSLASTRPAFECGYGDWPAPTFRHLRTA